MSYELTLEIAEESPEGRNIDAIAEDERLTREEAALRLLQRPTQSRNGGTPHKGSRIIGSFSTPEESALIDDAMALVFEERERRIPSPLDECVNPRYGHAFRDHKGTG